MNTNEKKTAPKWLKITVAVVGGILLLMMGVATFSPQATAQKEVQSLQEQVESRQKTYDEKQKAFIKANVEYCESWVELANAKKQLTDALQIKADSTWYHTSHTDCSVYATDFPTRF